MFPSRHNQLHISIERISILGSRSLMNCDTSLANLDVLFIWWVFLQKSTSINRLGALLNHTTWNYQNYITKLDNYLWLHYDQRFSFEILFNHFCIPFYCINSRLEDICSICTSLRVLQHLTLYCSCIHSLIQLRDAIILSINFSQALQLSGWYLPFEARYKDSNSFIEINSLLFETVVIVFSA